MTNREAYLEFLETPTGKLMLKLSSQAERWQYQSGFLAGRASVTVNQDAISCLKKLRSLLPWDFSPDYVDPAGRNEALKAADVIISKGERANGH